MHRDFPSLLAVRAAGLIFVAPQYTLGAPMLKKFIGRIFSRTTQIEPDSPSEPAYSAKAEAAFATQDYQEARRCLLLDIEARGDSAETLCGLGAAEAMLGNHAQAEQRFRLALRIAPGHLQARLGLANVKLLAKQHEEAIRLYGALAQELPDAEGVRRGYVRALAAAARYDDLERVHRERLARAPEDAESWAALSSVYLSLNRYQDAQAAISRGLGCAPLDPWLTFNRSYLSLQGGDLATGWALYEHRFSRPKSQMTLAEARWDGAAPRVNKIVVYEEQGYGDLFMFLRFVPRLQDLFESVTVACRAPSHALVKASFDVALRRTDAPGGTADALGCCLLSLPYLLKLDRLEDLQMRSPYIRPSAAAAEDFRFIRAHRAKARIGVVWAGNLVRKDDAARTLTLADTLELLDLPNVCWFLLQKGRETPLQIAQRGIDLAEKINDFDDLAAAMANLDAVISVDTAAAHLAGAMGKETFLLEPFTNDWRWRIGATESPWYNSVRLYKADNDPVNRWASAIARLKQSLVDRFQLRDGP